MNPSRFSIPLIFIYFSFNFLFLTPAWAENNSMAPQYINQTNISEPDTFAHQYLEGRLNLLDSQVNDLVQSTKKPQKDRWDKLESSSVFLSGVIIGIVSIYFTRRYQNGQLAVTQSQARVEKFKVIQNVTSSLKSAGYSAHRATLEALVELDVGMALNFAQIYFQDGGVYALIDWSKSSNVELSNRANQILSFILEASPKQALELYKKGVQPKEIVKMMENAYRVKQPGATEGQVKEFVAGIELLLRSQKK